jgi:hypothetical protein
MSSIGLHGIGVDRMSKHAESLDAGHWIGSSAGGGGIQNECRTTSAKPHPVSSFFFFYISRIELKIKAPMPTIVQHPGSPQSIVHFEGGNSDTGDEAADEVEALVREPGELSVARVGIELYLRVSLAARNRTLSPTQERKLLDSG